MKYGAINLWILTRTRHRHRHRYTRQAGTWGKSKLFLACIGLWHVTSPKFADLLQLKSTLI